LTKSRLEAFSDGVIAIIITIMVLELHAPHGSGPDALRPLIPALLSYILSFIYVGIYWNNHHHMFQAVSHVGGAVLWANLHLLFWLSLVPFTTNWMGETHFSIWPVICYGIVLICAAVAYAVLARTLVARHGRDSVLARAIGNDSKGNLSLVIYGTAIGLAFLDARIGFMLYGVVAAIWIVPDRRIERAISSEPHPTIAGRD
jgi:uncharacterized membrane protein